MRNDVYDIIEKNRYIEFKAKDIPFSSSTSVDGEMKILNTKKRVTFKVKTAVMKTGWHYRACRCRCRGEN